MAQRPFAPAAWRQVAAFLLLSAAWSHGHLGEPRNGLMIWDPPESLADSSDDAGRVLTITNRRNKTFWLGYGSDGLPTTFTYPTGRQAQITARDARGFPQTLQSPGGNQATLAFDARGRLASQADAAGTITWTRDNEGRATGVSETGGAGTATITRSYDNLGRVLSCMSWSAFFHL